MDDQSSRVVFLASKNDLDDDLDVRLSLLQKYVH